MQVIQIAEQNERGVVLVRSPVGCREEVQQMDKLVVQRDPQERAVGVLYIEIADLIADALATTPTMK